MTKRPNIIIFNPDSWRGDVMGHLGDPAAVTPNLDSIVRTDAVSFRNAFCQNPVCTPSRCSFMSGWYPHVRGHRTMYHMLQPDEPVLLKTLKDEGYFVWWGGKNDLVPGQLPAAPYCDVRYRPARRPEAGRGNDQSWRGDPDSDTYYSFYMGKLDKGDEEKRYDVDLGNVLGAIDFLKDAPKDKPFCIFLSLGHPHPPYGVEEPWFSMIDRKKLPKRTPAPDGWKDKPSMLKGIWERQKMQTWTEDRWDELRATYYGMCAHVDDMFGMLMDGLQKSGLYDDTAVFFLSDHGDFTGDYGLVEKNQNTFEDCLSRVPFVVKPPASAKVKPGVRDALVELVDFPATVEAVTGIIPKHTHFGRSLLPVIAGETDKHRDAVFCEGGRLHGEVYAMELESASSQQPGGLYWPRVGLQSSEGPEHTKAIMCRTDSYKYVRRFYEKDELYDLRKDPMELHNVIDDPSHADTLAKLKERLLTHYQETCDVVPHHADSR